MGAGVSTKYAKGLTENERFAIKSIYNVLDREGLKGYSETAASWVKSAKQNVVEAVLELGKEFPMYESKLSSAAYDAHKAAALEYEHGERKKAAELIEVVARIYDLTGNENGADKARHFKGIVEKQIKEGRAFLDEFDPDGNLLRAAADGSPYGGD